MGRRTFLILGPILLLVAAGVGWYFGSPAWTLREMASAAQARDSDKLSRYVDYPKLRESTKAQLKAQMTARLGGRTGNGFAALGMMVGKTVVDNVIDGMLTPDGMTAMFAAERGRAASTSTATTSAPAKKPFGVDASNREIVHDGLDRFRLHDKSGPGDDGDLIFERHGLGWKLAQIEIPPNLLGDAR